VAGVAAAGVVVAFLVGSHIVASDLIHIFAAESQLGLVMKLVLALAAPLAQKYWMDIY